MIQMALSPACNTTTVPIGVSTILTDGSSFGVLQMVAGEMAGIMLSPYRPAVKFNRKEEMAPPTKGTQAHAIRKVPKQDISVLTSVSTNSLS